MTVGAFRAMMIHGFVPVASSGGGGESITALLSLGAEIFTWLITQMGALITFIFAHPLILTMFGIMLAGLVVGMFMRVFHSVR